MATRTATKRDGTIKVLPTEKQTKKTKPQELSFDLALDSSAINCTIANASKHQDAGWKLKIVGSSITVLETPENVKPPQIEKEFHKHLNSLGWKSQTQLHREALGNIKPSKKNLPDFDIPKKSENGSENGTGKTANNLITGEELPLDLIEPSPLPSQIRRRARFDPKKLDELAVSIGQHGIVNPITVRPIGEKYQIVAGERRFLSSGLAGKPKIPAIIKELDDIAAAEIQLIENGQREDQHPLDEAYDYQDMKDVLNYSDEEISLRVGKPLGYVLNRLKLTGLSQKVRDYFEKKYIMFSHALEISKYPADAHDDLLQLTFNNFGYANQTLYPLANFIDRIEKNYLLQLKKAPFPIKSIELRADKMPCVKCPERTNANPLLFEENFSDKDCCLNRVCWNLKTQAFIQIQRRKIVETEAKITEPEKVEKAVAKVPYLTDKWYLSKDEQPAEGKCLTTEEYKLLKTKDDCKFAEKGVYYLGDRIGQSAWICRSKSCKTHLGKSSGSSSGTSLEKELAEKRNRKEEIVDINVGEPVRRKVLKTAAETFDENNTIFSHVLAEEYSMIMLKRFWYLQCHKNSHTAEVIREILGLDKTELTIHEWHDQGADVDTLSPDLQARLMFLLLFAHHGEMSKGGYWSSQKEIKRIADDYEIDYQLFDAQERLGYARMKDKELFRNYLQEIEAGKRDTKPPRVYSETYKAKE